MITKKTLNSATTSDPYDVCKQSISKPNKNSLTYNYQTFFSRQTFYVFTLKVLQPGPTWS